MATRIWILDGHNVIFALPGLHRLQITDRRDEARRGLVARLRRFARARGETVLVVFDGNAMPSNPDAVEEPLLEVVYARRGEGEADDRILHEARRRLEQGQTVTVVTDDLRTLAWDLPKGVRHLEVREFWSRHIETPEDPGAKRVDGDFSDIEQALAAQAAVAEPRPGAPAPPRAPTPPPAPPPETTIDDRIRLKREQGRQRQERRLGRRSESGRPGSGGRPAPGRRR